MFVTNAIRYAVGFVLFVVFVQAARNEATTQDPRNMLAPRTVHEKKAVLHGAGSNSQLHEVSSSTSAVFNSNVPSVSSELTASTSIYDEHSSGEYVDGANDEDVPSHPTTIHDRLYENNYYFKSSIPDLGSLDNTMGVEDIPVNYYAHATMVMPYKKINMVLAVFVMLFMF